ncbi:MAG: L-dopachrome tautomerase-related protein [Pseudomonadota bacterium]
MRRKTTRVRTGTGRAAALALGLALGLAGPAAAELETLARFGPETPPGNVTVSPDGRIFMSLHRFYGPELRVVEVLEGGETRPYPTADWARAPEGDGPGLNGVLGLRADRQGVLWLLDGRTDAAAGRLVAWDTRAERLSRVITLAAPVTRPDSFLNDLAVDLGQGAIYIADSGGAESGALIVVDIATGRARRVLEGSPFTTPEDVDMVIDGRVIALGGAPARIGVNPITLDPAGEHLYFGPMNATSLYRVRTRDLLDETLSPEALAARVARYGDKPVSDGSTVDGAGNVYISDVGANAIGVTGPDGAYRVLHQDPALSWPDAFSFGPDGRIYAVINELHRSPPLNGGDDGSQGLFKLVAFPPLAPGAVGR